MKKMMTSKPKKIIMLESVLRRMAVLIIKKYKPKVIGITGSVGKTSTKEAVYAVLSQHFRVRRNEKNYNNEIGLPLPIIGAKSGHDSFFGWVRVFCHWLLVLILPVRYPEILVLEMGADRPGDIKYLTDFIHPDVGIITDVSASHLEFFKTVEGVAREKGTLVRGLGEKHLAVINQDNPLVANLKANLRARSITFGFTKEAEMRAADVFYNYQEDKQGRIQGLGFKLNFSGTTLPVRLNHVLAKHQIYAVLAAAAVGAHFQLNLVEIASALENFLPPPGRMNLLAGIKNTSIIDDSYNSSPTSATAALETLSEIKGGRKIAVLGDMLELGTDEEKSHRSLAKKFLEIKGDIFITVGKRMLVARAELTKNNFAEKDILSFSGPIEAGKKLQEIIRPGDVILVKGSQGMRMEKIVEEIMAEPQKAGELLCRQNREWKKRPFRPV